jgi:hypothetical protein
MELDKFDLSSVAENKLVVIVGKRATGKTFLTQDLMFHHRDIPAGTVVSSTIAPYNSVGAFVPPRFIHADYSPEIIQDLVDLQSRRSFLILDDCMFDLAWVHDTNMKSLFANPPSAFVFTMAYPLGLPTTMCAQVDYVFIFGDNLIGNRKRLFKIWASDVFPSFDVFCQVMDKYVINAHDHACLVFDRKSARAFWYRAEPHDELWV